MTVSQPNPTAYHPTPTPPLKADGAAYRYEMIHDGGNTRTWGDTPVELVTALIPGYADLDNDDRAAARLRTAVDVQVRLQAWLTLNGDLDACTAEQRALLLGDRARPPHLTVWDAPIPLLLVTSYYHPYTEQTAPRAAEQGEVLWLDPTSDWNLLVSLTETGVLMLSERDDKPTGEAPAAGESAHPSLDREGQEGRRGSADGSEGRA